MHWFHELGWVLLDQPLQRLVWDQPLQTNLYSMFYYICSFSPPMVGPRTDLQPLHPIICVDFPRPWLVLGPTFNICTITTSQPASQAARSYRNSCMPLPQRLVLRKGWSSAQRLVLRAKVGPAQRLVLRKGCRVAGLVLPKGIKLNKYTYILRGPTFGGGPTLVKTNL